MKLSELVRYKEQLDGITPREVSQYFSQNHGHVIHTVREHEWRAPDQQLALETSLQAVYDSVANFDQRLLEFKQQLQLDIEQQEREYFRASYDLYEKEMVHDTAEHVLGRRFDLSPEQEEFLISRAQFFSDFHYAGMIIRPGREQWIHYMVACDPLYLVDESHDLLAHIKDYFNPVYNNRLRWTTLWERGPEPWLQDIPDGQIGFCLAYNFFHYKPWEVIKSYLSEIMIKLRPGGTVAFTFNDCDRSGAVANAERHYMTYTPGRLLRSLCESLGYVIRDYRVLDRACTWVEATKPGSAISLKAGQTLAKPIDKSK